MRLVYFSLKTQKPHLWEDEAFVLKNASIPLSTAFVGERARAAWIEKDVF